MTIHLKLKRHKSKSKTPVVFAISKEQKDKMRAMFDGVIAVIVSKKETPSVWYNACFRVKQCYEIAKQAYEITTVIEINLILTTLLDKCNSEIENWFVFTDAELELLITAHEAMCVMENETTRRVQLDAVHTADKFMKTYIKPSKET
jgi:hypothetical protein